VIKEEESMFWKVTVSVIKVRVKLTLEQATKAQRGVEV
jgi:hypothetical protein